MHEWIFCLPRRPHYINVMSDTEFDRKPTDKRTGGAPLLACYDDLTASCAYGWSMLERGVKDRKSAFHTPSIATISANGSPTMRTVVLRGCATAEKTLAFPHGYTLGQNRPIAKNPLAAMHFYDAGAKIQLRLAVRLEMLSGAAFDAAWEATRPMSRECYQVTQSPGSQFLTLMRSLSMPRQQMMARRILCRSRRMSCAWNGSIWPRAAIAVLCLILNTIHKAGLSPAASMRRLAACPLLGRVRQNAYIRANDKETSHALIDQNPCHRRHARHVDFAEPKPVTPKKARKYIENACPAT